MKTILGIILAILIFSFTSNICLASIDEDYQKYLEYSKKADKSLFLEYAIYNYPYDVGLYIEWDGEIVGKYRSNLYISSSGMEWICWCDVETADYYSIGDEITVIGTIGLTDNIRNKYGTPLYETLAVLPKYIADYKVVSKYRKQYKHEKEVNEALVSRPNSYYSAEELYNEGLYDRALSALEPALDTLNLTDEDILPSREDVYLLKSKCEFRLKNYDQALTTLVDLNKIDATNIDSAKLEQEIRQEKYNTQFQKISLEIESIKAKKEGYFVPFCVNLIIPSCNSNLKTSYKFGFTVSTYLFALFGTVGYVTYFNPKSTEEEKKGSLAGAILATGAFVTLEIVGYILSYKGIHDRNEERDKEIKEKEDYLESIKP